MRTIGSIIQRPVVNSVWKSMEDSMEDSIWSSVSGYDKNSVWKSVMLCVGNSVWNPVRNTTEGFVRSVVLNFVWFSIYTKSKDLRNEDSQ